MILQSDNILLSEIHDDDYIKILEIYNSNKSFLHSHLDKNQIDLQWIEEELELMKKMNFKTLKIQEKASGQMIGFIDLKFHEQSYLSLLMIHNDFHNKGYGKAAYALLEEFLLKEKVKNIRIDVVYDYDNIVMQFWINRGFNKVKNIQLRWGDQYLGASMMNKTL